MCEAEEINNDNFDKKFIEIKSTLKKARFISIDCEFSALNPLKNQIPSLFDSPSEYYLKIKRNIEQIIPLQIGLTAFSFDSNKNHYIGKVFTFYVKPACFPTLSTKFYFQSNTIKFLTLHNFDFNKFAYKGISYINRIQEKNIREHFKTDDYLLEYEYELENFLQNNLHSLEEWYFKTDNNHVLNLNGILKKHEKDYEFLYFIKSKLHSRFKNIVITKQDGEFVAKKLPDKQMMKNNNLDDLLTDLLGFTRVFRLLVDLKKPIIGHNILQDVLLMINSFECTLPDTYNEFKLLTNSLFPTIFDTKTICYQVLDLLPFEKRWKSTRLQDLFDFFQNGLGTKLGYENLSIEVQEFGQFHNAGWDSYCSGYIFIKLANFYALETHKIFTNTSVGLINSLDEYKNCINLIRGSTNYIKIDGNDPVSKRPPWLVISKRNKPININEISSLLCTFGYVELKKIPLKSGQILIAVDNFGNAKRMLKNFKHPDYEIKKYNPFKHSTSVQLLITGCATLSTIITICVVCACWRK